MSALLDESYDGAHGFGCEVFALGAFAESDVCAAPTGNAALDPTHSPYFLFSAVYTSMSVIASIAFLVQIGRGQVSNSRQ